MELQKKTQMAKSRNRRSISADASLQAEIERTRRMTVEERIRAALSMRSRLSWLKPVLAKE